MNLNGMIAILKFHILWVSIVISHTSLDTVNNRIFQAGIRANGSSNDLIVEKIEYWRCLRKCRKRSSCIAVSYHGKMHICYLSHQIDPVIVVRKGFIFSRKSDWTQGTYTWCADDQCAAGYTCSGKAGTCEIRECPWPEIPNNGFILGNKRNVGAKVAYLCDMGFKLYGRSSRKCYKDGNWQRADSVCVQVQ